MIQSRIQLFSMLCLVGCLSACGGEGIGPGYTEFQAKLPHGYLLTKASARGGPDIALDVWVTQEQEGLKGERVPRHLLLLCNPDTQSSVWATPPKAFARFETFES